MKKLLTLITGLAAGSSLYAMAVLNPAEPALVTDGVFLCDVGDCWGVKFGYRGDFVVDRHMKNGEGYIGQFGINTNSGVLTLNFWDRLDVFGWVGAENWNTDGVDATPAYVITHSKTNTVWGVGADVVLWETCWGTCGTTYLGLEAEYESFGTTRIDRASREGAWVNPNNVGRRYKETQISLGLAHRINFLVPYIAVKWSNAVSSATGAGRIGTFTTGSNVGSARSRRNWGYAFGATLVDVNRMTVTAEARFVDETAYAVSADIRF